MTPGHDAWARQPSTRAAHPQGMLVRRHKIPKDGGGLLSFQDLLVGGSVKVYGK